MKYLKLIDKAKYTLLKKYKAISINANDDYSDSKSKKIIISTNLLVFIYNLLAFYFYYLSLEGCFKSEKVCIPLLLTMFLVRILIYGIIFSLMISIEIFLIIHKKINVLHGIYVILFYAFIYEYDHGSKLDYHGTYNFSLSLLLIFIFSFLIGIFDLICFLIKKKSKIYWWLFFVFSGYIFIRITIFSFSLGNSCRDWDKGLNGTRINNSPEEYNCQINYPKKCLINILNDYFDLTFYINKKCSVNDKQESEHEKFIKYLRLDNQLLSSSKLTHFGMPITVNNPLLSLDERYNYFKTHNFVYRNTILMDLYNSNKGKYYDNILKPEIEIFYDKKTKARTAKINLIKNETMSKIRNEIAKNASRTNFSLYNNIMVIFLDSLSRQHFLRTMKKTASFIEKFMKYDNNLGFNSYQFMKYQTFASWTPPNAKPMFFSSNNNKGKNVYILKYLKENGFVTGNSGNLCAKEAFPYDVNDNSNYNIILDEYDHENIAMFCEPNYSSEDSPYPLFSGPYAVIRKCLFGLDTFKYLLEFGNQFWNLYPHNKKFLRLSFQEGHEPTGNIAKYLDEYLYNFLNDFYKKQLLNDTALFILSDHGNNYFSFFYNYILNSDDSLIERTYGSLFIILPSNKNNKIYRDYYYKNAYINQQTLISPFDIHDTLIHIIFGNNTSYNEQVYSHYGESLLAEIEGKSRDCSKWEKFFMLKGGCLCKKD